MTTQINYNQIKGEVVNVLDYGATGVAGTNQTAACQAAIDYAYANGAGTVYFPAGVYDVTSLTLTFISLASINITGAGRRATIFRKYDSSTTSIFNWDATGFGESYSNFKSFSIDGTGRSGTLAKTYNGIKIINGAKFYMDDLDIYSCDYGVYNLGGAIFQINNCTFKANNIGYGSAINGSAETAMVTINGGGFQGNANWGVDFGGCAGGTLNQVDIEQNGTTGSSFTTGAVAIRRDATTSSGYANFCIDGCWFEGNKGICLYVESAIGNAIVEVLNTPFYSTVGGNCINANDGIIRIVSCVAASAADFFSLNCLRSIIINTTVYTLSDTSTTKYYESLGGNFATIPFNYPSVVAGYFNSISASAAGTTSGVAATLYTFSAFATVLGIHIIEADVAQGSNGNSGWAMIAVGAAGITILTQAGTTTFSSTGLALKVTQNTGGTQTVTGRILKIGP